MGRQTISLRNGLNTSTDRTMVQPGQMVRCCNFEVTKDGTLRRSDGFRRFSGGSWFGPAEFQLLGPQRITDWAGRAFGTWGQAGGVYSNPFGFGTTIEAFAGKARFTYDYSYPLGVANEDYSVTAGSTATALIATASIGRLPFLENSIYLLGNFSSGNWANGSVGKPIATWPTSATAYEAHLAIDNHWKAHWDQQNAELTDGATSGAEEVPAVNTLGGIAGVHYWRDRAYVVADTLIFRFANATALPAVGDIVRIDNSGTDPRYYCERIILQSGSTGNSDAVGSIWLSGPVPGYSANVNPVSSTSAYVPGQGVPFTGTVRLDNITTGVNAIADITHAREPEPGSGILYRSTDVFSTRDAGLTQRGWERVDTGYEVAYKDGSASFVTVDRTSTDEFLIGGTGNPAILATDWTFPTALGSVNSWTTGANALADDGIGAGPNVFGGTDPYAGGTLAVAGFQFSVPAYSIITGIEVRIERSDGTGNNSEDLAVFLLGANGEQISNNRAAAGRWPAVAAIQTYGSATDLWDASVSPEIVNSENFGVALQASSVGFTSANGVDYISARIHYKPYESRVYFNRTGETAKSLSGITASEVSALATTSVAHGFTPSDTIVVRGAVQTEYNQAALTGFAVPSTTTFRYPISGVPVATATGTITAYKSQVVVSITRAATTATATVTAHGFSNGQTVAVTGADQAAYNGDFVISNVTANTFDYTVGGSPATPATGLVIRAGRVFTVSSIAGGAVRAVATAAAAHGWLTGQYVTVAGATPSGYNGNVEITVTSTTAFTYAVSGFPTYPATGTLTATLTDVGSADAVYFYNKKGSFDTANDAVGVLTIYGVTNPDLVQAGVFIRSAPAGAGTLYATAAGAANRVYFPSSLDLNRNNSQWEWLTVNLSRAAQFEQIFGVSGADYAFSYDGKYVIRIRTGVPDPLDKPRHVGEHNYQIQLGYEFGDVAFSDLGAGESFSGVVDGSSAASYGANFVPSATTVSLSDPVRGILRLPEQSSAIFCQNSIRRISGSGGVFTEQAIRPDLGILEYTARNVNGMVCFTDTLGIMKLRPNDLFGQLSSDYVSAPINSLLSPTSNRVSGLPAPTVIRAMAFTSKNQYRLFCSDGSVIGMTMVGAAQDASFWIGQLPFVPFGTGRGVHSTGAEISLATHVFGSQIELPVFTGTIAPVPLMPVQLDVGNTWAGQPMPSLCTIYLGEAGELHAIKRFGKLALDVRAQGYANFGVSFSTNPIQQVAQRVVPTDFVVRNTTTAGEAVVVGSATGGDYLNLRQYQSGIGVNAAGDQLLMTVECAGDFAYDSRTTPAGFQWLAPFELGAVTMYVEMNRQFVEGR